MDAATLLGNSLSPDNATRQQATQQLQQAMRSDYGQYLITLASELANESQQSHIRNAAGIAIKNALTGRESTTQSDLLHQWRSTPPELKAQIKQLALRALTSADKKAASVGATAVAALAGNELPFGEWGELIGQLLEFMGREEVGLRVATLQCIGFICEVVDPRFLASRSNEILTAVVQGARKEEQNPDVQTAAIQALYNSLEFIRDNFEREGERNYIMQVVCEATQSPAVTVQIGAFECLVRIMQLYYDKMKLYMERALFGLTVLGMQNEEEKVALQAIEFWSTVCEVESDLALEAMEASEEGEAPVMESQHFAKVALPEIVPQLLVLMQKQDEDAEEDEWNVAMAAGTCIGLLAGTTGDAIINLTLPFIEQNIQAADWHQREAAVMVFGSILDGPGDQELMKIGTSGLPLIVSMLNDQSAAVRDTASWALGRITDLATLIIKSDQDLPGIVNAIVFGLQQTGRISANCCWSIKNLSEQYAASGPEQRTTSEMSQFYQPLLDALMKNTESRDNTGNARTATYDAIATLAENAPDDTLNLISAVGLEILSKSEKLLEVRGQLVGIDDKTNWNELASNCCSVITAIIRRVGTQIGALADRIMQVQLSLLQSSSHDAAVAEDAYLTISSMIIVMEEAFEKYTPHLMNFVFGSLNGLEDFTVFNSAVGIVGDLARAIGPKIRPFADTLMQALLAALASPVLHRTAKPAVVSVFGDLAIALGPEFQMYLENVMGMLSQAGTVTVGPDSDIAMQDFVWQMRESITEAFLGILTAFANEPAGFSNYVQGVLQFMASTAADEDASDAYLRSCYNLLGDLASTYKSDLKPILLEPAIARLVTDGQKKGMTKSTKTALKYARAAVKAATA